VSVLWADRNLDVRRARNGDLIKKAESAEELAARNDGEAVWFHYGYDKGNCKKWGKMYAAANIEELEKLLPDGWRIPTLGEWVELLVAHGMTREGNFVSNDNAEAVAAWKKLAEGPFKEDIYTITAIPLMEASLT
jgi:uncharacterized protein (TIGR02145 family)